MRVRFTFMVNSFFFVGNFYGGSNDLFRISELNAMNEIWRWKGTRDRDHYEFHSINFRPSVRAVYILGFSRYSFWVSCSAQFFLVLSLSFFGNQPKTRFWGGFNVVPLTHDHRCVYFGYSIIIKGNKNKSQSQM